MESAHIRLAKNLNKYMQKKGWTQLRLSIESGVSRPIIGYYVHAQTLAPDIHCVRKIADALGVSVSELLKGEE